MLAVHVNMHFLNLDVYFEHFKAKLFVKCTIPLRLQIYGYQGLLWKHIHWKLFKIHQENEGAWVNIIALYLQLLSIWSNKSNMFPIGGK